MDAKVFVTGAGIISALGTGIDMTRRALFEGKSGIGTISRLHTVHKEFPAGEVDMSDADLSRMLGVGYPADRLRTALLGIAAAREAIASAGLTGGCLRKAAFINGTTVGGMDNTERHFGHVLETDAGSDDTAELKFNDCGYSTGIIADNTGRFGFVSTTSTACSSAANAIILGAEMIKSGIVDIVVAGGAEALTAFHLNGFNTLMILDREVCRPFDRDRAGINLGEGAAYIVLESERSVSSRGAEVMALLSGYANTCDAFHQTASSENGEGAFLAMTEAMSMASLSPSEIGYVNAHGTGTPNNDMTELAAMRRIWGDDLPPFSSTKALTGHTTSASGAIEAVICLLALRHDILPENIGWKNPVFPGAVPVTGGPLHLRVDHIIDNSFGFGGNDSTLIFSRHTHD